MSVTVPLPEAAMTSFAGLKQKIAVGSRAASVEAVGYRPKASINFTRPRTSW